jgi:hypothetical protein
MKFLGRCDDNVRLVSVLCRGVFCCVEGMKGKGMKGDGKE